MLTKNKLKKFKLFGAAVCAAASIAGLSACKDSKIIVKFNCDETARNVAYNTVYELPEYYVTYSDGSVKTSDIALSDKDGNAVAVSNGKFFVEQNIGEKYKAVYSAADDKETISYSVELTVVDDSAAPVLVLDKQVVCVAIGDYVGLKTYYTASDDSGIEPILEYTYTFNGETSFGEGGGFIAEEGLYDVDLRVKDSSGHYSETKRLSVVARSGNVIADFETSADIRDSENTAGVRIIGANMPERSKDIVHGGNYSLYVNNNTDSETVKVVPFNASGDTNGDSASEGSIIGGWYYFLPKDESGVINLKFTLAPDYVLTKYGQIEIYVDGAYYASQATVGDSAANAFNVAVPTEKWVYVQFTVKAVDGNFYIGCAPQGYSDYKMQFYLDDFVFGLKSDLSEFDYEVCLDADGYAKFNPAAKINAFIINGNTNHKRGAASYRLFKETDDGYLRSVSADDNGEYKLVEGTYRAYLASASGEYAGIYATVKVTNNAFSSVKIDLKGNEELPVGAVDKKYPVPVATADEGISAHVKVYYEYYGAKPTEMPVSDGAFTPDKVGEYTVEYVFTKNSEIKTICYDVIVRETISELSDNYDEIVKLTSAYVGEKYQLQEIIATDGSGVVAKTLKIVASDGSERYLSDNTAVFEKVGTYEIVYEISDYFTTETYKYSVTVTASALPIVETEAVLPRYFNSGFSYSEYKLVGKIYSADGSFVDCELKAYWRYNGVETPIENGAFIPAVNSNGDKITVVYKNGDSVVREYEVPVVIIKNTNENKVNALSLFDLKNCSAELTKDGTTFTTESNDNEIKITRPVLLSNLSLHLFFRESGLKSVTFVITDSENAAQNLSFYITETGGKLYAVYNGESVAIDGSFEGGNVVLSYNALYNALYDGKNNEVVTFGSEIKFSSGKVYIDIKAVGEDENGGNKITLRKINGQEITLESETAPNLAADYAAPELFVDEYTIVNLKGTTFTIPKTVVSDLYDENPMVYIAVKKGNKAVTSTSGVSLDYIASDDYSFVLSEAGSYTIVFITKDCFGNTKTYQKTVWSIETDVTLIQVEGEREISVKVGATVKVPSYVQVASGNVTVYTYLCDEQGYYDKLTDSSFKAENKGTYKIAYYAVDSSKNIQIYHITIVAR